MDKSLVVNLICALLIVIGIIAPDPVAKYILGMGTFGFSGAITNWLAVHMLFERVPGLYGSGIIPLKFQSFKAAIRDMIMNQFFTEDNIKKFTSQAADGFKPDLVPVIEKINYDPIFDGFVEVIQKSKFGGALAMFGGAAAVEPMREPFIRKLKTKLSDLAAQPDFLENVTSGATSEIHHVWQEKIASMVDHRLEELTPQMVKDIIQEMIRSHLGWLVVWGGVFGSLIGLFSALLQ